MTQTHKDSRTPAKLLPTIEKPRKVIAEPQYMGSAITEKGNDVIGAECTKTPK